ncbi:MAG: hypothetical protein OXK80_06240 [Bdellovibrionales bacterium]|nr:hypothetical protein [Bdellovibrionales bacterium]
MKGFLFFILFIFLLICSNQALARQSGDYYKLQKVPSAVVSFNEQFPDTQITNISTYKQFYNKDPKLPSWSTLTRLYEKKHGSSKGLARFIFQQERFYTLEEIPSAVASLNKESLEEEQIRGQVSYKSFYDKDPKLPSWMTLARWYRDKHGSGGGLADFVFQREELYTLEEIPSAVASLNKESLEEEQIRGQVSYKSFYDKDPKLPSWMTLARWYREEHGSGAGLASFVFQRERLYSLEEVPSAVVSFNEKFPDAQMTNISTYKQFYDKDSKLPSWSALASWYREKHDSEVGLADFVFQRGTLKEPPEKTPRQSKLYILQEVPSAVASLNKNSSVEKQMTSKMTYEDFRDQDPKLPSWMTLVGLFKETYGHGIGVADFVFRGQLPNPVPPPRPKLYTLEDIPSAIINFNIKFFGEAYIRNQHTYEEFRSKDPKLPSWGALARWYKKIHGSSKGLADFMFSRSCEREMATL